MVLLSYMALNRRCKLNPCVHAIRAISGALLYETVVDRLTVNEVVEGYHIAAIRRSIGVTEHRRALHHADARNHLDGEHHAEKREPFRSRWHIVFPER